MLIEVKEVVVLADGNVTTKVKHVNPEIIGSMQVYSFGEILSEEGGAKNYTEITTTAGEKFIVEGLPAELSKTIISEAGRHLLKG